jgi:hypothetical protein
MAQAFSTGPVDLWVGIGSEHAPVFLGHSENGYEIKGRPQYENVMNDVAGMKIPYDRGWQGADYVIEPGGSLTRWNEPVYAALQQYVDPRTAFGGGTPRGSEGAFGRGRLMLTEGLAFGVWLRYPYSALPAYGGPGMPAGYHFFKAVVDADSMSPGAKAYKIGPVFYSWPVYVVGGAFVAFDHDMSALGAIN